MTPRIPLAWWEALLIVVAYVVPVLYGTPGVALLTALAASVAFGVWRIVRMLGQLLELKQAEVFDEDKR